MTTHIVLMTLSSYMDITRVGAFSQQIVCPVTNTAVDAPPSYIFSYSVDTIADPVVLYFDLPVLKISPQGCFTVSSWDLWELDPITGLLVPPLSPLDTKLAIVGTQIEVQNDAQMFTGTYMLELMATISDGTTHFYPIEI